MTKHLTVLICALILAGFAGLAAAEPAPAAQPTLFSQGASCPQATFSSVLVSECQGWMYGSCDRKADCKGFACPLGELKACIGGTGSDCRGTCGCVP